MRFKAEWPVMVLSLAAPMLLVLMVTVLLQGADGGATDVGTLPADRCPQCGQSMARGVNAPLGGPSELPHAVAGR